MSNPPATNHQPLATVKSAASWAVPSLLCLILYWPGLLAWFQQDDFVWLNLPNQAHGWDGLLRALFQPTPSCRGAGGRSASARSSWHSARCSARRPAVPHLGLPHQFANLALVASVTTRLTRSRAAGFWAAILWVANSKLATVMSWTSAYILVLCGFFLLLALHLFLRYTETSARRNYYLWTWLAFLTGFLAMETNVVFPLLAGSYALLCARQYFRRDASVPGCLRVPMPSCTSLLAPNHAQQYAILTSTAPSRPLCGPTGARRLSPSTCISFSRFSPHLQPRGTMAASTVALLAFTVYQAARRQWLRAGVTGLVCHRAGSRASLARPHHRITT